MNKIIYAALVGFLAINTTANCVWDWETTGWFTRANSTDQREAYIEEVVYPVLRNEIEALKKDAQWATQQAENWKKSYYRQAHLGQSTEVEGRHINNYRKLAAQALEDKEALEKHGGKIVLGWTNIDLNQKCRLRREIIAAAAEFRKKYDITPEQEEKLVLSERKPSGTFFSPLEEK